MKTYFFEKYTKDIVAHYKIKKIKNFVISQIIRIGQSTAKLSQLIQMVFLDY